MLKNIIKKSNKFAKKRKISIILKANRKAEICEVADTHGRVVMRAYGQVIRMEPKAY